MSDFGAVGGPVAVASQGHAGDWGGDGRDLGMFGAIGGQVAGALLGGAGAR